MHRRNETSRRAVRTAIESVEPRYLMAGTEFLAATDQATSGTTSPTLGAIAIYDVSDIRTATAASNPFSTTTGTSTVTTPLFSIWVGYEVTNAGAVGRDFEEPSAIGIAPGGRTGYLLSFDSGSPGTLSSTGSGDSNGDYDLYRFDIQAAYNDFITNNRSRGVLYAPRYSSDYIASDPNTTGIDYVATYGSLANGPTGLPAVDSGDAGIPQLRSSATTIIRSNKDTDPSNDIVFLDGVTKKVGEVARTQPPSNVFFNQQDIQVVSDDKIVLMENASKASSLTGSVADDYSIRTLERVSATPGAAVSRAGNTGGFNQQTTESWESFAFTGDNYVQMDASLDGGVTFPISDVDGMRYVDRNGVKGVWVSDRDGGGDDFSFFALDLVNRVATKQEFPASTTPYPKTFGLDEDPTVSTTTNDGDLDGFDLDANGNLVIRESDFTSVTTDVDGEPKIFTHDITNYNGGDTSANGINEVIQGGWSSKGRLAVSGAIDDDAGVTNGLYGVYDAAQNLMYYFDIDSAAADGAANANPDVYVYDLATQTLVFSKLNIANTFLNDGNSIRAFTMLPIDTVAPTVAMTYTNLTEQAVTLQFSENVAASFAAGDLVLRNNTTNTTIPTADLTVTPLGGNAFKVTYKTGASSTPLPRGRYTLTLTGSGVTDAAGNAVAGLPSINFNVQPGDANGDGATDFADLVILAQNYNQAGRTFAQGNLDYSADGVVGFADLVLLAQNYNQVLPAAVAAPKVVVAAPKAVTATKTVAAKKRVAADVL